ncbi:hypothetical protein GCM10010269_05280 [Streptomyces humidus]|uniref:Uncharacterized protein n=1 Tax=Streptomyces humidus TaxID=52259 RepID=A0A918FS09_9ACTN|nr:hypothetical protein GCM10010269_05280 [Streptomyces humidus]
MARPSRYPLDPAEAVPVLVDERYERVCGRSSSAAKKLAAAFRISFARFSSAFSFLSALSWADSSVVVPGRCPACAPERVAGPGVEEPFVDLRDVVDVVMKAVLQMTGTSELQMSPSRSR